MTFEEFFAKIREMARERGVEDLLDCEFLQGKLRHGEYGYCEKYAEHAKVPPFGVTIYECIEFCPHNFLSEVELKDEYRIYMGPKAARVPRGAVVKLVAVVRGRTAIFEWMGERFSCPVRILHRLKRAAAAGRSRSETGFPGEEAGEE